MKSARYGLLTELALLVECLAPGQNCIACMILMHGRIPLKGDSYSNIATVSTLLLLCAIARVVKEKEKNAFYS